MHYIQGNKPLLCRELVGRTREVQELREALQRARAGKPQIVVLAGEAGMGKSKLCHTLMEESQTNQALVLFGQALLQDQALPFGPFLDAFRRYFSSSSGRMALSDPSLLACFAFLLQLLPELASLFPGITVPTFEMLGTPAHQQEVVFHHMLSGLQALINAHQGPIVLILEDLHWADETSLELLAFLASRLAEHAPSTTLVRAEYTGALMILCTYRVEALPDHPALQRLLSHLYTQRQSYELRLTPLSALDHWHCVSNILGSPVPEAFSRFLFDWDGGNPFFVEELLGAMAATGQLTKQTQSWHIRPDAKPHLPPSLAAAILERFLRLPPDDQEVLAYAAVIGRTFNFPLLAALCGIDERKLVEVLRRAMNAQLIGEVKSLPSDYTAYNEQEHYWFRHTLTREAIYEHMLAPERRLRHQRVAETLEQMEIAPSSLSASPLTRSDNTAQLLAEHYWLARLPEKARPYALQEIERVSRLFAFREERHYLNMVQASLPQDGPERLRVLMRMGMLSMSIYELDDALRWLELAKAGYQRRGEHHKALYVMVHVLLAHWQIASPSLLRMVAEIEVAAERAFAELDSAEGDVELLAATALFAQYWAVHALHGRSQRWLERCFALYESLDDPGKIPAVQVGHITNGYLKANQRTGDFEEGLAEIRHAIDTAINYTLPDVIMVGHTTLVWILISWGHTDEAEQILQEAAEHEERSGTLPPSFVLGLHYFFTGKEWEQAIVQLNSRIEQLDRLRVAYLAAAARVALAHILLARNELREAELHLQAAQSAFESNNEFLYISLLWWGCAKLHTAQGNPAQARREYERILSAWKATEDRMTIFPLLLDGIIFYVELGDLASACRWLSELEGSMQVTDNPIGAAALLEAEGAVRAREGEMEPAIEALRRAVEAWGKLKLGYRLALTSQRLAEVLLTWTRRGSMKRVARQAAREEANLLLDRAVAVYERLGIPGRIEAIQALRSGTRLEAQQKRRRTLALRHPAQNLTQREMQVLIQLAAGKTNREIAAVLNLSEGTVEVHISHILAKLDCETRTGAAAYAIAKGWVKQASS